MNERISQQTVEGHLVGFRVHAHDGEQPVRVDPPKWSLLEAMAPFDSTLAVEQTVQTPYRQLTIFQVIRERILKAGVPPWFARREQTSEAQPQEHTPRRHPSLDTIDKAIATIKRLEDLDNDLSATEIRRRLDAFDARQEQRWRSRLRP